MEEEEGEEMGEISGKERREGGLGMSHGLSDHISSIHLNIFTSYKTVHMRSGEGVKAAEVSLAVLDIGLLS